MPWPIQHLPVLQNWDCHGCGDCCREYIVPVTEEERSRIQSQGWEKDPVLAGLPLFTRHGPPWARRYQLNQRSDGSCIFLSDQGRCRIHERFGPEAKPLPCRIFPFVLIPTGEHWRVGLRFVCPSVATSKGKPLSGHDAELTYYATTLAKTKGLEQTTLKPPLLQSGQQVDWPDLLRFADALVTLVRDRRHGMHWRWRKCLALARLCRQARFDKIQGERLGEFLDLISTGLDQEVPVNPAAVEPPTWTARILFRQAAALYTRQDTGPERGEAERSTALRLWAAWQFVHGTGRVPRMHAKVPETTFERLEEPRGALPESVEQILERYYSIKIGSLQFCGATNFGLPFWEGLESLALTFPIILWLTRAMVQLPRDEAVRQAIRVVDNPFGYRKILGMRRQRIGLRLLASAGELDRLIAWYSR